jgi:hypothetical protein
MNRLVEEAMDIKLHRDNINTVEGFKLGKAWNASNSLSRQCNTHTSRKSKENAKKETKCSNNRDTRLSDTVKG